MSHALAYTELTGSASLQFSNQGSGISGVWDSRAASALGVESEADCVAFEDTLAASMYKISGLRRVALCGTDKAEFLKMYRVAEWK